MMILSSGLIWFHCCSSHVLLVVAGVEISSAARSAVRASMALSGIVSVFVRTGSCLSKSSTIVLCAKLCWSFSIFSTKSRSWVSDIFGSRVIVHISSILDPNPCSMASLCKISNSVLEISASLKASLASIVCSSLDSPMSWTYLSISEN